jgi:hypothetical protein
MIKIVYFSETIDNWGRTESTSSPQQIYKILNNPDDFTDDMKFEGPNGEVYFIDDLIGKEVIVNGYEPFIVQE